MGNLLKPPCEQVAECAEIRGSTGRFRQATSTKVGSCDKRNSAVGRLSPFAARPGPGRRWGRSVPGSLTSPGAGDRAKSLKTITVLEGDSPHPAIAETSVCSEISQACSTEVPRLCRRRHAVRRQRRPNTSTRKRSQAIVGQPSRTGPGVVDRISITPWPSRRICSTSSGLTGREALGLSITVPTARE